MIQQQQQLLLLLLWTAIFGRRRRDFTQEITAINVEFFRDESHMALTFTTHKQPVFYRNELTD